MISKGFIDINRGNILEKEREIITAFNKSFIVFSNKNIIEKLLQM